MTRFQPITVLVLLGTGVFTGASLALWLAFGDGVYAAYLSGLLMTCF